MKTLFRILTLLALLICFASCGDDNEVTVETELNVNYANIAGTWYLSEWNGEQMNDSRYYYITLNRKEVDGKRTYEIYTNYNSAFSQHITGIFNLDNDEDWGYLIGGTYDHQSSTDNAWEHSYVITNLFHESMVWKAKNNPEEMRIYTRCNEVPEDIIKGTRSIK